MKLILLNEIHFSRAPTQKEFQRWINETVKAVSEKLPPSIKEVCISIVDKDTSAALNQTYRHKNGPTNVLSFPNESIPGILPESLGDLAICADLVEEEAYPNSPIAHWAHLTIHGILHLYGYDHIIDKDAEVMETLEVAILAQLGYQNPY